MDDLELREQFLAVITERTASGLRPPIRVLHERFQYRSSHQLRREAEWLSKRGLIQSKRGGYAVLRVVDKDSCPAAVAGAAFEIPLHRLMAGR